MCRRAYKFSVKSEAIKWTITILIELAESEMFRQKMASLIKTEKKNQTSAEGHRKGINKDHKTTLNCPL